MTLLFTDIEASSEQWEADPRVMGAVLSRHDEILRGVIAADGGFVVLLGYLAFRRYDLPDDVLPAYGRG